MSKKQSLKEVYLKEEYAPTHEELVDAMVDIFDEMMKGNISDRKYQNMIDNNIAPYVENDNWLKLVMIQAKKQVLKNTDAWLSREIDLQTD